LSILRSPLKVDPLACPETKTPAAGPTGVSIYF
jgi:hypothetical protein